MENPNSVNVSTNLPDAENSGSVEKTFPNVAASGERVPGEDAIDLPDASEKKLTQPKHFCCVERIWRKSFR